jgi:hypothetical protein
MNTGIEKSIREAMKSGKIFSVVFTKKDGSSRKMRARMGVTKHHVHEGRPSTTSHIPKYLTVFDLEKEAYRTVNVDTITDFKCGDTLVKTS